VTPIETLAKAIGRDPVPLLPSLTFREREVIRLRYGIGFDAFTLAETAATFGTTRLEIRRIEARALAKMKSMARSVAS
jgi:DNA-directed RNA polymerase sigma subunit (sigma70/sigma32)